MAKAKTKGMAALNKIAGGKSVAARKSSIPVCQVSDDMDQLLGEFSQAKADMENAKARKLSAEMNMEQEAQELRMKECLRTKTLHASVKLAGKNHTHTFTQKSQCLKMTSEVEDEVRSIVDSDEDFDNYFEVKGDFKIDAEALASLPNADKVAEALVRALGDNAHILSREEILVPTSRFYNDKVFDRRVQQMAERLEDAGLAKPHKPSFK